jgi:hypothetical protein
VYFALALNGGFETDTDDPKANPVGRRKADIRPECVSGPIPANAVTTSASGCPLIAALLLPLQLASEMLELRANEWASGGDRPALVRARLC